MSRQRHRPVRPTAKDEENRAETCRIIVETGSTAAVTGSGRPWVAPFHVIPQDRGYDDALGACRTAVVVLHPHP
jgi:hypothetical protein